MEAKLKKILLLVLITTAVIEISTLLGITIYWRIMNRDPVQSRLCLSPTTSSLDKDVWHQFDKQDEMYCGSASLILNALVNKTITERYNSDMNPEHSPLNISGCTELNYDPSILKLDRIESHFKFVNENQAKVYWSSNITSDKAKNVEYLMKEGLVYVNTAGKYFISSQLLTKVNNRAVKEKDGSSLKHFVYLISRTSKTERVLLEKAGSNCSLPVDQSEHTSYIAAVFKLQEGDRIYVATSHPHDLLPGHSVNHFIIQKI